MARIMMKTFGRPTGQTIGRQGEQQLARNALQIYDAILNPRKHRVYRACVIKASHHQQEIAIHRLYRPIPESPEHACGMAGRLSAWSDINGGRFK
jgi:hypothetical protein